MKVFISLFAIIAAASAFPADPAPYHPPAPAPYHAPAPAPYHAPHKGSYKEPAPQPFQYKYGVKDDYSGANFEKSENQNDYGVVEGSYRVALPDGRVQTVTYHADKEAGFIADVSYEGQAQYPPEPKEGYGYHPAPKAHKALPYHA